MKTEASFRSLNSPTHPSYTRYFQNILLMDGANSEAEPTGYIPPCF
jgi:hypothetical protein